jgi:uncharacterized metal-binding protein
MICTDDSGSSYRGCPTVSRKELLQRTNEEYADPETLYLAKQASVQEASCYENRHEQPYVMQPTKTRILEIMEFAARMKYKRLGLAFCVGLRKEAAIVNTILETNGFEVLSVCCKAGRTSKDLIGIEEKDTIYGSADESMCNPIFQARLLNEEKTDFNILLGLCVGHDSLFFKHANAYTTVLAVKDRVTGHNPLAAVYLHESYYRKLTARAERGDD